MYQKSLHRVPYITKPGSMHLLNMNQIFKLWTINFHTDLLTLFSYITHFNTACTTHYYTIYHALLHRVLHIIKQFSIYHFIVYHTSYHIKPVTSVSIYQIWSSVVKPIYIAAVYSHKALIQRLANINQSNLSYNNWSLYIAVLLKLFSVVVASNCN